MKFQIKPRNSVKPVQFNVFGEGLGASELTCIKFAARYVVEVSRRKKEKWFMTMAMTPYVIHYDLKERGSYSGMYRNRWRGEWLKNSRWLKWLKYVMIDDARLYQFITCRVFRAPYPVSGRYNNYFTKDMPEYAIDSLEECLVALTAHELAHTHYPGGYEGEFNCELIASDAVTAWRKRNENILSKKIHPTP